MTGRHKFQNNFTQGDSNSRNRMFNDNEKQVQESKQLGLTTGMRCSICFVKAWAISN